MEQDDLFKLLSDMHETAEAIVHNQLILNEVHKELQNNIENPFEQDSIYEEHFGQKPSEPKAKMVEGVQIITRVLHQTGKRLSDIKGADLLYEIEGEKFILVQFKKSYEGKVKGDKEQLERLLKNCPPMCPYKIRTPERIPFKIIGLCGIYYRAHSNSGDVKYLHACEAKSIFGKSDSVSFSEFSSGMSKETFIDLFAICRIGAITGKNEPERIAQKLINEDHVIYSVLQRGKWNKK